MKQKLTVTIHQYGDDESDDKHFFFNDLQKAVNFQQSALAAVFFGTVKLTFEIEKEVENERDH